MKVALETFVADVVNFVDRELNRCGAASMAVPRKHRIYLILEKLEELQFVERDDSADTLRFKPTEQWLQTIIEERQLQDEIEISECLPSSALPATEKYKQELSKIGDAIIFDKAAVASTSYRGMKLGIIEYRGGVSGKKKFRMTKRARKLVERIGLDAAIAYFEARIDPTSPLG
jgi:hypothetical protein